MVVKNSENVGFLSCTVSVNNVHNTTKSGLNVQRPVIDLYPSLKCPVYIKYTHDSQAKIELEIKNPTLYSIVYMSVIKVRASFLFTKDFYLIIKLVKKRCLGRSAFWTQNAFVWGDLSIRQWWKVTFTQLLYLQ